MKRASLASRYRPQTFGEVIGQSLAASALSRAALEDRVAPAYLLSGTRGVGKTTIARIFAKALNCERGPAAEPCNVCRQCRQITAGSHVDVNEIDGASNTGVDDVRALRENIGFMPMEGRYKIFIVDEAHMLSKNAFNALLKTLEEPPPRATFIFATTEAHRFPATILSRCQRYVFRHLPEDVIFDHLKNILDKEKVAHDDGAVRLIARRAAGSARDGLSLLDQTLALCGDKLDEDAARRSLGLAGRDFFALLLEAVKNGDLAKILALSRELTASGVDIGFFTRELSTLLRDLFLHAQAGDAILSTLALPPDEEEFVKKARGSLSPAHLHAAWQMTLESQKSITQNPEPGVALELLLLNLALLPGLLPAADARLWTTPPPMNEGDEKKNSEPSPAEAREDPAPFGERWQKFCEFCDSGASDGAPQDVLRGLTAEWRENGLFLRASGALLYERARKALPAIENALKKFCGDGAPNLVLSPPGEAPPPRDPVRECANDEKIDLFCKMFNARVLECAEKKPSR